MNGNDPAFPTEIEDDPKTGYVTISHGLTKRECFAAMAMQGLLSNPDHRMDMGMVEISEASVRQADSLIAELNKEK